MGWAGVEERRRKGIMNREQGITKKMFNEQCSMLREGIIDYRLLIIGFNARG
jgi:hypothetical protein